MSQPWDMTVIVGAALVVSLALVIWAVLGGIMLWQSWKRRG